MLKRISAAFVMALVLCCAAQTASAATLSPTLQEQIKQLEGTASVGTVIIAFHTRNGLQESHLGLLRSLGIVKGITLQRLGMVAAPLTAAQVKALASNANVRSVWSNERLSYFDKEARTLTGADRVRAEASFTRTNGGLPVTGAGVGVVINDSGIDATHDDLKLGKTVVQNVQIVTDTDTLSGFTPLVALENLPNTDLNVGHGTHCAGIVAASGQMSGGLYRGVAPGAHLIGTGSGAVLFILNALGGFEYAMAHQTDYQIRIISNSYGGDGPFNPDDPVNIASKIAHDEYNMIVVFAGGNSGPGRDTYNPYAKAPWVIGVAAGTKEGGLASFSSRGTPREDRLTNSDPLDDLDAPTIVAPGAGREFESNAAKFSAAYVSTRSKSNIFSNGLTDDAELPVAFVPFYTQIVGTSMATPYVAGVAALMLDADPSLSADDVKSIIVQTASRMPGYEDYEVGAGYINAYAAVDKVFNRAKRYGKLFNHDFNAAYTVSGPPAENIRIDYTPAALPGPGGANSHNFTVEAGMSVLDVFARFDNIAESGDGNSIGILLTDPSGKTYSSGIALPILDSPRRQVVVKNPEPGPWLLEVRGVRGLAALPNVSLPTSGAALPGPVDITITQKLFTLAPIADIQGHAAQTQIEMVLKNRQMDTFSDGLFHPDDNVTREDLALLLYMNTPLRQSLGATQKFSDVSAELSAIAEAVTAKGSTLRDWDFSPAGMMSATGSTFNPQGLASRLDVAVALVRALGLDAEARAKAGTNVTVTNDGVTYTLTDNAEIPSALRGYVQIALDKQLLQAFFTMEQGPFDFTPKLKARVRANDPTSRAFMAYALDNFRKNFVAGN